VEKTSSRRITWDFLITSQPKSERTGGFNRKFVSTNWATQSRVGLVEKKLDNSVADKRRLVEPAHPEISVSRQCELLDLARSRWYYKPVAVAPYELHLMNLIDQKYTATRFYGIRRMTVWLNRQGEQVNHKRVARLMRQMGMEAIYPHLSNQQARRQRSSVSLFAQRVGD
jgi:hypothetical protein